MCFDLFYYFCDQNLSSSCRKQEQKKIVKPLPKEIESVQVKQVEGNFNIQYNIDL